MESHPPRRTLTSPLLTVSACGSVGGGLTEMGHGGTLAAVVVSIGPAAIYAVLFCIVLLMHRMGRRRYLSSSPETRQAILEYDTASVDNTVSLLSLTRIRAGGEASPPDPIHGTHVQPAVPAQRGGSEESPADITSTVS
jgi:hypothetical protein